MVRDDAPVVEVVSSIEGDDRDRFGKYRSLGRIGRGGMADVFLAVARGPAGFNKLVVIKRLRDTVASDDAFRQMFLDEARLAARLNHPNVVQTYDVFEHEGSFFITMEYLEGQPLSRLERECRKREKKIEHRIHARIVSDALCGLHYAHEARDYDGVPLQIVHRDVSPQNIFVTYDGQIKVVDFGIAKAERSNTKTQVGFFKGKTAYMAPEQLEGGAIDRRVDVFTSGIVLWELLAGRKLMAAETQAKTLMRLLREPIPHVADIVPDTDANLDRIVARALERDPAARFQTAGEMRNALEQYLAERDHLVRHDEIGRIVGEIFGDVRADMQRAISVQMARPQSVFPQSGPFPVEGVASMPGMPVGLDPRQPTSVTGMASVSGIASMSGISISQNSSALHVAPTATLVVAQEPARSFRMPSIVVAAIAAVAVAVVFTLLERAHIGPATAQSPPPVPMALPPAARAGPPPILAGTETSVPEPPRVEPSSPPSALVPSWMAVRPPQATPAWHPGHAQVAEPRQASPAGPRSAASASANTIATPTNPAPPAGPTEPARAQPTAPPTPSTPAPAPPQEGRKFQVTL
ncbi:MAG: protein kinase [Myxococcota bacterium]|nr:protein kinase [Myxococcota bacterium]